MTPAATDTDQRKSHADPVANAKERQQVMRF